MQLIYKSHEIVDSCQAGSKYRDSGIDTGITLISQFQFDSDSGIDSGIDSTYKHPLNKPVIQLSQPPN